MVKVDPPRAPESYRNVDAYQQALRNYHTYRSAIRVWRQISKDERLWILNTFGYKDAEAALERDGNKDLKELKLRMKHLRFIQFYPRSPYRRKLYRDLVAGKEPVRDVHVTRYEKRARQAPRYRLEQRERAALREREHQIARIHRKRKAGRLK